MSEYYNVYDRTGNIVRGNFKTWKDAHTFLWVTSKHGKMPIHFCV